MFYDKAENRSNLMSVLKNWENVPYEHMGETKSGIDCSKLLAEVLIELGQLTGKVEKVFLSFDWIFQVKKELMLEIVDQNIKEFLIPSLKFEIIERPSELKFGDLLFFNLVRNGNTCHSSFYCGENKIFHCLTNIKCKFDYLSVAWKRRITYCYRLLEV